MTLLGPELDDQAAYRHFSDPAQAYAQASRQTEVLALQSGEPGTLAQVV